MTINNFIILVISIFIVVQYYRKNYLYSFIVLGMSYICLPVFKLGSGRGLNSAYFLTMICFLFFVHTLLKKRIVFDKIAGFYLGSMMLSTVIVGVGWLINGIPKGRDLIHFVGMGQYIVAVYVLVVLTRSYQVNRKKMMEGIIIGSVCLNYFVGIIQLVNMEWGEKVIRQLYVYAGKESPLEAMCEVGRFVRIFGTFYSSPVLGIISLIFLTYVVHGILIDQKVRIRSLLMYVGSLGLGILAFSKTVIIGVFLIWLLSAIVILLQKRCLKMFVLILKVLMMTLGTFLVVGCIQYMIGLGEFVDYYYFKASNIGVAMQTRYESLLVKEEDEVTDPNGNVASAGEPSDKEVEETSKPLKSGNLRDTFEVFTQHPIIGVGPSAINNEFIGDSEYVTILHNGGLVNFLIYAVFYGSLLIYYFIHKRNQELFVLMAIGMGGISLPVFSASYIIPFLAFGLGGVDIE